MGLFSFICEFPGLFKIPGELERSGLFQDLYLKIACDLLLSFHPLSLTRTTIVLFSLSILSFLCCSWILFVPFFKTFTSMRYDGLLSQSLKSERISAFKNNRFKA